MQNEEPKLCISFDLSHRQSLSLCISSCPSFYCCLYLSASLPLCGFAYIFLSVWVPPLIFRSHHFIPLFSQYLIFSVSVSFGMSVHLYLSVWLSLSVCLTLFVCLSVCLPVFSLSVNLHVFICLSDSLPVVIYQSACLYMAICLSLSVCLLFCLPVCLSV